MRTIPLYNHLLSIFTQVGSLLAILLSVMGQLNLNWVMWSSLTHRYLIDVTELQLKSKHSTTKADKLRFEEETIAVEDAEWKRAVAGPIISIVIGFGLFVHIIAKSCGELTPCVNCYYQRVNGLPICLDTECSTIVMYVRNEQ